MEQDRERIAWIVDALQHEGLDALVCTLPENVLILSGYWPVVGTAVAIAGRDGRTVVLAPEDERDLAIHGFATEVWTYAPGSLTQLTGPMEAVREPLGRLLVELGLGASRLGFEDGGVFEESTYAAMFLFQAGIRDVLQNAAPESVLVGGLPAISRLRSRLTPREVGQVRLGCQIASEAFTAVSRGIGPGLSEPEVAERFNAPLSVRGLTQPGVQRAGGFTWCMSGPNSALAGAAYARTRDRTLQVGDLVLIHCNSYLNGYWTDITRTYVVGSPDDRQRTMYSAIFAARHAALDSTRPGVRAADVDLAARQVLTERGFGQNFTHGIGHNVGFSAISAEFPPRLHPASPDRLEVGMTFNIEPAIYIKGHGGIRHCDVVTLGPSGPEVLTPFQSSPDQLILLP